jgi:hypothetical protein
VTFVGFISNIHAVCHTYKWLGWVCKAPGIIVNLIQGFASTVLLVILFMLVPIILRILARLQGIPQKTGVELTLMDRFFMFQVIVSASCPALNQASYKNTSSERLSGCHIFVWYYRVLTRSSKSPDGSSGTSGSEPTKILDVLLDVSVLSELSSSLTYSRIQIHNSSRSCRNSHRLPSNWAFGHVLCQNYPPCF